MHVRLLSHALVDWWIFIPVESCNSRLADSHSGGVVVGGQQIEWRAWCPNFFFAILFFFDNRCL